MTYFDHNASTPLLPAARLAWIDATENLVGNPSSPNRLGTRGEAALTDARERVAGFLGCDSSELIWTSGATESLNTVIHHVARSGDAPDWIWLSAIEHPCVTEAARTYFPNRHRLIPVTPCGVLDLDWLRAELARHRPALIAVMAANHETGILQPWPEASALCRERGVPFLCDAAQWLGKLPAEGLGECDFVAASAHKFGGPRGVGFLKCPARGRLIPLLVGGAEEDGRRAGTENVQGALATAAALEFRERQIRARGHFARLKWRQEFETALLETLPGATVMGDGEDRLWNTVLAVMPETGNEPRWVVKLDEAGFAVSNGSACASGQERPSHVLTAMGLLPEAGNRALRFSSGWETGVEEWQELLGALKQVHASTLA